MGAGPGEAAEAELRRALERGVSMGLHRGVQVAAAYAGRTPVVLGVGTGASGAPVDEDTQFPWACASKLLGVLCLGRLVSAGVLDYGTPLEVVLPELEGTRLGRASLSDVVTHQAGITLEIGYEPLREPASTTLMRLADHFEPDGADAMPAYLIWSNWFLVGQVVERLVEASFADHVTETILRPLGADRTVVAPAQVDRSNAVEFEMGHGDSALVNPLDQGEAGTACVPGYSFCGPASDLVAVMRPFVDDTACEALGISSATMAEICRTRRSGLPDANLGWAPDWGFGVATDPKMWRGYDAGDRLVGHVGVGGSAIAVADRADAHIVVALFGRAVGAFPAAGRSRMTLQRASAWHAALEQPEPA